jgi:hypothetical protein
MKANSNDELVRLISENDSEYPSLFLHEDSFAYKCYSSYTFSELEEKIKDEHDARECAENNISPEEWKEGMLMAYTVFKHELSGMPPI